MLKKKLGIEAIEVNWSVRHNCLIDYFKIPSTLIIPEGCDHIGDYAFWSYNELKEVIIPKSVVEIGYKAFFECRELEEVEILGSVRAIGKSSFERCVKLKEMTGADRVVVFGDNLNDISMMSVADVAVAVENAYPQVKEAADIVIGRNTEDAVAKFIKEDFEK